MDKQAAAKIIRDTFESPFDKGQFAHFVGNLLNKIDETKEFHAHGVYIPESFKNYVRAYERIGTYTDPTYPRNNKIDVLIVHLQRETSLEHARTAQRNFVARYLKERGEKEAGLVAFVAPHPADWRFSLVKMEYRLIQTPSGEVKATEKFTPARRFSFLVGENESSHTAQVQLLPILQDDKNNPSLPDLESAFSIEVVTKEFFRKYRDLFHDVDEALRDIAHKDKKIREDFAVKGVNTVNFSKKLMGQIVFLYFLQKKGWFGVGRDEPWGTGSKSFLRLLFEKRIVNYRNFFNDILEPLFYEALAIQRTDDFYSRFNCKIPFLNGGLFDPINNYDWVHTDILLPDKLFSNIERTKEGDIGTGILDVFDRYNFTVKEDEPLEKEVAVDPEMLGRVFENLLEVKDRKSKGTYYTPREIVHYMCQESLINYLDTAINTGDVPIARTRPPQGKLFGKPDPEQAALKTTEYRVIVPREDIENFVRKGELAVEHDRRVEAHGKETERYSYRIPETIRQNAKPIDEKLAAIRVCDPAVGSGAFPVSLMTEIVKARTTLTTYLPNKEGSSNYYFKRHAIQNCLYGVDIDPGAIEIAKLRLWLSLVVDEEDIRQIKPLPNLDYKIVCGNSLLGVEKTLFNLEVFEELETLKPLHFNETNVNKKLAYKSKIDQLIGQITNNNETFDFEVYFSEVFHEKGGFDVAIANPPYVLLQNVAVDSSVRETIKRKYESAQYKVDTYHLFIELAIRLLNSKGVLAYITPNTFLKNKHSNKLRKIVVKDTLVQDLVLFFVRVFDESSVDNLVIICKKAKADDYPNHTMNIHEVNTENFFDQVREARPFPQRDIIPEDYLFEFDVSEDVKKTIHKMERGTVRFGEIGRAYFGIQTFDRTKFVSGYKKNQFFRPVIDGTNIFKYGICPPTEFVEFKPERIKSGGNPEVYKKTRIVIRQIGEYPFGAICPGSLYTLNTVYNLYLKKPGYDTKYVLSIINSNLIKFFWLIKFYDKKVTFPKIKKTPLESIPIKAMTEANQKPFVDLVDRILAITKDEDYPTNPAKQAKVKEYERQIDKMVYQLYNLTPEEIAIVEGFNKK